MLKKKINMDNSEILEKRPWIITTIITCEIMKFGTVSIT